MDDKPILSRFERNVTTYNEQNYTSGLFALPPELRNRIYELILRVDSRDGKVSMVKLSRSHAHARKRRPSVLRLLLVCRQIYVEARGIFYNINHLKFTEKATGSDYLRGFLSTVSEERLKAVNAITLILPESLEGMGLLWLVNKLCPRIRVLHVMPAYVSSSIDLDKHIATLMEEFTHLEEFKAIDAPWRAACKTRTGFLQSIEALVQRNLEKNGKLQRTSPGWLGTSSHPTWTG